jgi:hypothetical protein
MHDFEAIKKILLTCDVSALSEPQVEKSVVAPILEQLGWTPLPQEHKVIQGKTLVPDWTLFASPADRHSYLSLTDRKHSLEKIASVVESKAPDQPLDTRKANRDNPYFQLLEYLTFMRLPFGFLTNGREWRIVDNREVSAEKQYVSVFLEKILIDDAVDAFRVFHALFGRKSFVADEANAESLFTRLTHADAARKTLAEDDLRRVVYGTDGRESMFEQAGKSLFAATGNDATPGNLGAIFENALYFVFRLLFVSYFEDRHWDLLKRHSSYSGISLRALYDGLHDAEPAKWSGWAALQRLFDVLDRGDANLSIPLLNGGLFDKNRAPMLALARVMNNGILYSILNKLLTVGGNAVERRDFQSLSVTHLGGIYESLLEYEFRVAEEDISYIDYRRRGSSARLDGYFDLYDAEAIRREARGGECVLFHDTLFPAGSLYLVGSRNSRKVTASYYTPQSLSFPLVKKAIDHRLEKLEGKSILDLRILDNACGSGHVLIECLRYLANRALERMDSDGELREVLKDEKSRIDDVMKDIGLSWMEIDEFAILRRILLKRVIYGVDLQPFAVELAHLGLWIETFIFGTPLSFIEHHVKAGNALIGTSGTAFRNAVSRSGRQSDFLWLTIEERSEKLLEVRRRLNRLQDTTAADVEKSKRIYASAIIPVLDELKLLRDAVTCRDMQIAEMEGGGRFNIGLCLIDLLNESGNCAEYRANIENYQNKYGFFNYALEFPEVFSTDNPGFDIIVGNPPWDKTKFEDPMFFEQYRSNYRSLPNSRKAAIRVELLSKPYIREKYETRKRSVRAVNGYLKNAYPLNAGSGDGNLFRFFVERNIRLLAVGGTLNYVLPTALLTDDGSTKLRKYIFEHLRVNYFDGFENRLSIFPDVDSRYKFGLLQIEKTRDETQSARMRFMLTDPLVLNTDEGIFDYPLAAVRAMSPVHMAYMEAGGGAKDIDLLTRFYRKFAPLNPEWIDFHNELHATGDRSVFHESGGDGCIPLYKGASIHQYDSLYGDRMLGLPEYWLNCDELDDHLRNREIGRMIAEAYPGHPPIRDTSRRITVLRALGLREVAELGKFVVPDRKFFRLCFRAIASDTNERTLLAALVPKDIAAQHALWVSVPKKYVFDSSSRSIKIVETPVVRLLFAQAVFNSIAADWVLRFSTSINVTKSVLMRQPMPQPTDEDLSTNPVYMEIARNSALLSLYFNHGGFREIQEYMGIAGSEIPATEGMAERVKIRNDVLVSGLYGVSRAEMEYMLSSFRIFGRNRPEYCAALISRMGRGTQYLSDLGQG